LLPRHAALLADARRRISAIKQYSSLGSGFKIAMRDLEIRGAGNLLGSEQSGHITAVGFELYCQLLKQSVAALKGERVKPRVEVEVRFDFLATSPEQVEDAATPKKRPRRKPRADVSVPRDEDAWEYFEETVPQTEESKNTCPVAPAFLPLDYIGDSRQRIDTYRRLAQATTRVALDELTSELRDRFGKLPKAVELLMLVAELKIIAAEKLVNHMETENDALKLMRNNDYITLGGRFPRLVKKNAAARLREVKKMLSAL
jgi:transcription-repair coupling factor (superfamily II helicase)